jgi:uncharacterized protein DUF6636
MASRLVPSARCLAALGATVALAACSGPSGTQDRPATAGLGDAPKVAPKVVTEAMFKSPSGNIGCYLDAKAVRCDIGKKSWNAPAKPADCELDWGSGISVQGVDEATFTCAGDTVLGAEGKLEYGDSLRAGDFLCSSDSKAMRCENVSSGHGFTLAIARYTVF